MENKPRGAKRESIGFRPRRLFGPRRFMGVAAALLTLAGGAWSAPASYTSRVNPFIGTTGGGNTFPGPSAPFGMVQFSPDTRAPSIGYDYTATSIQGFSMTHMSGVGCDDEGDVFLTATTGPLPANLNTVADYSSPFDHAHEAASPGYYRVHLNRYDVEAELTATTRAGMARFTFPAGQSANVVIPLHHTLTETFATHIRRVGSREIEGDVTSRSFCGASSRYTVYFVMRFDTPFQDFRRTPWVATTSGDDANVDASVTYPAGPARTVSVAIGISYVDLAGARENLDTEIGDKGFDEIRARSAGRWERELRRIETEGGTPDQDVIFTTALYHALLMPSTFNDTDGRYMGFDNKIHFVPLGRTHYASFSGWDIYRTQIPLLALIEPRRVEDMCESIADMYRQGGWIDRWPQANTYTNVMVGSPLTAVVATAWNAGLHRFDLATAYEGMWKDATQVPPPGSPYQGRPENPYLESLGFVPQDKIDHAVSKQEEDAYADSALASLAETLGKADDARRLVQQALSYHALYDPQTGFMRPKNADGTWLSPFGPAEETKDDWGKYTEGTAWEYLWLAPHDVAGLIRLMGGDAAFNAKLDTFFQGQLRDDPLPAGQSTHYDPYNEPDLQAPFLYDYSGQPWKTQRLVRDVSDRIFRTTPDGIPGNDDCGTMSAWHIFAAMGFYPVDPARPAYEMCSPQFSKITVRLNAPHRGKAFVITAQAASAANRYIQSATLNGEPLNRPWFPLSAITGGGTLAVSLGSDANKDWGAGQETRPPSLSR